MKTLATIKCCILIHVLVITSPTLSFLYKSNEGHRGWICNLDFLLPFFVDEVIFLSWDRGIPLLFQISGRWSPEGIYLCFPCLLSDHFYIQVHAISLSSSHSAISTFSMRPRLPHFPQIKTLGVLLKDKAKVLLSL